ncbi:MAG: BsuPI-related putative proteinase inhibitor [Anaerobacillus sp.]|uniref:BsuPI-related putative proteinase inhibitor n=1 Tax=Anaerobacillus sp. TaxID=1872506 RepID=UPI0039193BE5
MKKHWKVLSAITLATILATACGSGEVEKKVGGGDQTGYETPGENGKEVINDEVVKTDLQFSDGYYTFTMTNTSDKDIVFTIPSSQEYEYQLKDKAGEVVYTYSMDKMFLLMISEKTIAAGDSYQMNIDVEIFPTLQADTYILEVWSMATEAENLSAKMEITLEEVGSNVEGEYVGQIDNNSVEIIDADGNPKAYRLTASSKELVELLETDAKVSYSYFKQNEQLFLTTIHSLQ